MPAKTIKITVDGTEYNLREFILADFPETDKALRGMTGSGDERRDAMVALITASAGVAAEVASALTLREALEIVGGVLEVNGIRPKAVPVPLDQSASPAENPSIP